MFIYLFMKGARDSFFFNPFSYEFANSVSTHFQQDFFILLQCQTDFARIHCTHLDLPCLGRLQNNAVFELMEHLIIFFSLSGIEFQIRYCHCSTSVNLLFQLLRPIRLKFGSNVLLLIGNRNCKTRSGHMTSGQNGRLFKFLQKSSPVR